MTDHAYKESGSGFCAICDDLPGQGEHAYDTLSISDKSFPNTPDGYQIAAGRTAVYPGHGEGTLHAILYVALGLSGEAGEVANQVKKILRDDNGILTPERKAKIIDELGDCLWYVSMAANELGTYLSELAARNIGKLTGRAEHDAVHGDSRPEGQ
jgi:NTP pyrophosphatase (non-canonical NTP hydrolase)